MSGHSSFKWWISPSHWSNNLKGNQRYKAGPGCYLSRPSYTNTLFPSQQLHKQTNEKNNKLKSLINPDKRYVRWPRGPVKNWELTSVFQLHVVAVSRDVNYQWAEWTSVTQHGDQHSRKTSGIFHQSSHWLGNLEVYASGASYYTFHKRT